MLPRKRGDNHDRTANHHRRHSRQRRPASRRGSRDPAVSAKTWLAVIGATLGAFMAVLNIQIVNASLADIQGGDRRRHR